MLQSPLYANFWYWESILRPRLRPTMLRANIKHKISLITGSCIAYNVYNIQTLCSRWNYYFVIGPLTLVQKHWIDLSTVRKLKLGYSERFRFRRRPFVNDVTQLGKGVVSDPCDGTIPLTQCDFFVWCMGRGVPKLDSVTSFMNGRLSPNHTSVLLIILLA